MQSATTLTIRKRNTIHLSNKITFTKISILVSKLIQMQSDLGLDMELVVTNETKEDKGKRK